MGAPLIIQAIYKVRRNIIKFDFRLTERKKGVIAVGHYASVWHLGWQEVP